MHFGAIDETKSGRYLPVRVMASINGYSHEEDYWVTEKDFRRFVISMKQLNAELIGHSTLEAANSENDFSFSILGDRKYRGYLLIRTVFRSKNIDSCNPTTSSLFDGGFYSEPANLSIWLDELIDILDKPL